MLQKAEVSSRIRKGIQRQTVSLNLSEPKNRHIAQKTGVEVATQMTVTASVRVTTGSSSCKTGCVGETPSCAALELTTEMQKSTLDAESRFQRNLRFRLIAISHTDAQGKMAKEQYQIKRRSIKLARKDKAGAWNLPN